LPPQPIRVYRFPSSRSMLGGTKEEAMQATDDKRRDLGMTQL